jgi:DGQHR domain-containing protein
MPNTRKKKAVRKKTSKKRTTREPKTLSLPAIEITQGKGRKVYAFAVDGKLLPQFTTVTRIGRDSERNVTGYQRPEVLSHIKQIKKYLESKNPMVPNAIVIAFDHTVKFKSTKAGAAKDGRPGFLTVPLSGNPEETVGLLVDGQQRTAALRDAKVRQFPIFAVGFIAKDEAEQREQFLLVNSTKPLPKGLLYELLPSIDAPLPDALARKQFPSLLLDRLNNDEDSPFNGLISTPTSPGGVIKDNSILKMVENSLTDGALFRFRHADSNGGEVEDMLQLLKNYWTAVAQVFPQAWGQPPKRSRLSHGAGIVSLGFICDAISDKHRRVRIPTTKQYINGLKGIAEDCRWTDGFWDFGRGHHVKWSDLQNTGAHIQMLTDYLIATFRKVS